MAKYASAATLDGGVAYIKANATAMKLLSSWTVGNNTVASISGVTLATVTMTTTDFTLAGADNAARTCTTASGKSVNASASGGGSTGGTGNSGNCIAFCDSTNVLWVTDETSKQAVTSGNPVNFPSLVYTAGQPT